MISFESVELVKGVLTLVQTVVYKSGKKVKRILDPVTKMPIDIIEEGA